jgi:hypothetical protein
MQADFAFSIGDKVNLKTGGISGEVDALFVGKYGQKQALVAYVNQVGSFIQDWIDEGRLELICSA